MNDAPAHPGAAMRMVTAPVVYAVLSAARNSTHAG
jgi:hypothetical protein